MSWLLVGLLVSVGAWIVSRQRTGRVAPIWVLAVYLAPALGLAATLFGVRDEARFRFALLGVGFRGPPSEGFDVEVGGDRDHHGLFVSAYERRRAADTPEAARAVRLGRIRFAPTGDPQTSPLGLELQPAAEVGHFAMRRGGALQPLDAVPLAHGDTLRLGAHAVTVDLETGLFGPAARFAHSEDDVDELPRRRGRIPVVGWSLPIWRPYTAQSTTYPLAFLGRDDPTIREAGMAAGFLFHDREGLFGGRLWLSSAHPAVLVERDGVVVERPGTLPVPSGARVHAMSPPRWRGQGFRAGGIRDRRSVRLVAGARSVAALYDTPEVYVLPWTALEALAVEVVGEGEDDAEATLRVPLSMGGWQITDRSLYFRSVSRKVALEALATLAFPQRLGERRGLGRAASRASFQAATPRGQWNGRFGEALWLGGEHLAAVQIDVLTPPMWLALLAVLLALAKAATARSLGVTPPLVMLAGAVEVLVALRLLLGYRVWLLPPFHDEAFSLALVAWATVPWCLLVAAMPVTGRDGERPSPTVLLPAAAGWLFSLAWSWRFGGGGTRSLVWLAVHIAVLAVPLARHADVVGRLRRAWQDRVATGPAWSERRTLAAWCALAATPAVARLVLVLLGFRESLPLGERFALSLLHVPLGLGIEAAYLVWLWRESTRSGVVRARALLPAVAVVLGTWVLPALVVSDIGLALLNVPVFLLAVAVVTAAAYQRTRDEHGDLGWRAAWVPTTAVAVFALYVLLAALPLGARVLVAVLPDNESERNYLRLLDFAYPRRLEAVARTGSEELAVMSAVMRRYTNGPFFGRGYLSSEISPHIRATALREHVPAVFIAGAWGAAGSLGLLLVYLAAAGAGSALLKRVDEDEDVDHGAVRGFAVLGGLAAWTVALPSVYMMLATYRLTVFTGKNAYLLGLDSTADVLESVILVTMAAACAAVVRDREEAW